MLKKITIYTDGGARGNPGPAGIGIVIETRETVYQYKKYLGVTTNNQAEYQALIFALEKARDLNPEAINCLLDSELIVKQLNGKYKVKNKDLKPLFEKVIALSVFFDKISFHHIRREKNKLADQLVNAAIDANT